MLHEQLVLISGWAVTSCFIDRKCVLIWTYFMLRITSLQILIGWARPWQHLHKLMKVEMPDVISLCCLCLIDWTGIERSPEEHHLSKCD